MGSQLPAKISNWDKPGGTLGKIVLGLGIGVGIIGLIKALPWLITLASSVLTLSLLVGAILLIGFLITNKQFRQLIGSSYFLIMRKLTGLVIETNPIAIAKKHVLDMKKRLKEISKQMGNIRGLNEKSAKEIRKKQKDFEKQALALQTYQEKGMNLEANVCERQLVRLKETIERRQSRLEESKNWYELLKECQRLAQCTVVDTENEVKELEEEYLSTRAHHKAFKSIMSIMQGEPDELALFDRAMETMNNDISQKLGEMKDIMEGADSVIKAAAVDDIVTSKKAQVLLATYQKGGIEGIMSPRKPIELPLPKMDQITFDTDYAVVEEVPAVQTKYFN